MVPTRPLVLLSATTRPIDGVERVRLNVAYLQAVTDAGMVPLVTPPLDDRTAADGILRSVDGLILTGGEDVDPARYGASRHEKTYPPHPHRDAWELALLDAAHRRRLPTLAICRGIQIVNVAFGGTLVQHLPEEWPGVLQHDETGDRAALVHPVAVAPGSRLADLLGATIVDANSSHHQAVADPGAGLHVTAHAPDGVIEGLEWTGDDWWLTAVQWHPEELVRRAEAWHRNLFEGFAARCRQEIGSPA